MTQNNSGKRVEPLDDMPPIDHVKKIAEAFNKTGIETGKYDWLNDKSKDFYNGMYAALRICISGVSTFKERPDMTLDDL